ncbi:hypothetical protein HCN44_007565 [Aphidius gifuensis]|uniref:Phospholipid scramblase n=1 Tax=Aphidius gifuensis TaxID=684658 RepID=A0A834XL90_APHGI|nr:hypothetical protein HCN44_007565 [Aphidius gifuensis]
MEKLAPCKILHLSFDKKRFYKKNCIIRDENHEIVFSTSETNYKIVVKNIPIIKIQKHFHGILTQVFDNTGNEVFKFIRARHYAEIYSYSGNEKIGYMTRKEFSSKHTIFDCQNNKLLKIKLPTWSGTYADKYQVYDLNGIKIADIYRKSENSCYASISYLGDIDVTRKALVLSATILLIPQIELNLKNFDNNL